MEIKEQTPKGASTIPEFCKQHNISVALFYKLRSKMPRVREVGARRIITDEDAAEWRRTLPETSAEQESAA
jgi:hypothetical protein